VLPSQRNEIGSLVWVLLCQKLVQSAEIRAIIVPLPTSDSSGTTGWTYTLCIPIGNIVSLSRLNAVVDSKIRGGACLCLLPWACRWPCLRWGRCHLENSISPKPHWRVQLPASCHLWHRLTFHRDSVTRHTASPHGQCHVICVSGASLAFNLRGYSSH